MHGAMINVYDRYESPLQVTGSQWSHLAHSSAADWGKNNDHGHGGGEEEEEEEEGQKMHVQSRFIRALHTPDFVGLVKHTGRKANQVWIEVSDAFDSLNCSNTHRIMMLITMTKPPGVWISITGMLSVPTNLRW